MHVRIMKALVLFVLLCVGNCSANPVTGNDTQADGEPFKTNRIQLGSEELYIVTAADGKPLATIDVVRDEGYEIELTPDGSKCRLSQIQDKSSCFEEVPRADDERVSARVADRCKGREIVTLKPVDCKAETTRKKAGLWWLIRDNPCRMRMGVVSSLGVQNSGSDCLVYMSVLMP